MKIKLKHLKNPIEKISGLIGIKNVYPVYFTTRWGIHTFGMRGAIDVLILDDQNRVVKIKKSLPPGNLFFWNPKYYRVIEMAEVPVKLKIGTKITPNFV